MVATMQEKATGLLFLMLLQHQHDARVMARYVKEGKMPPPVTASIREVSLSEEDEDVWHHFDSASEFDEDSWQARSVRDWELHRIRGIRDILDNSVQEFYSKDPEVKRWADDLGGLRSVQEKLIGLSLGTRGWYQKTLKKLKMDLGFIPPPDGEPMPEFGIETATSHTSYAVRVHRELINRRAYGELDDEEDNFLMDRSIDQDFEISSKPWFWKFAVIGTFVPRPTKSPNLVQVDTRRYPARMMDLRFGDELGGRFKKLMDYGVPYSIISEKPAVREFIWRFYNYPQSLTQFEMGTGDYARPAFGMMVKNGKWMWAPMSYASWGKIKFLMNLKEKAPVYYRRAIYLGPWVYFAKKHPVLKDMLLVQKFSFCDQTGLPKLEVRKDMTPLEWGSVMRKLIKSHGAKDAYLGYPWKQYRPQA